jgi:hypothetical protein
MGQIGGGAGGGGGDAGEIKLKTVQWKKKKEIKKIK